MGCIYSTITVVSFLLQYGSQLGSQIWLSEWSNKNDKDPENTSLFFYLGIYSLLGIFQTVFVLGFVFAIKYAGIRAAAMIHKQMFARILRVPMSFFDTTPLGRVLNRFVPRLSPGLFYDQFIPPSKFIWLRCDDAI